MQGRPAVVFVPGFMQRAGAWAPVAERLGQSYPTVLVDHRGSSFEARLAEIEALAPPGAVLCGYSLGGRLVLHAALRAAGPPGRYGALALVGASAGIDDPTARARRRAEDAQLAAWIERAPIDAVVERWERLPVFAGQPPELVASQRAGRRAHEPRALAELLRSAGQGALEPVWDRLGELGALPLLALAGARDAPYAEAARRLAAAAPNGHVHEVPDAGHAAHLERPDHVAAALLAFLERHLGPPA